MLDPPDHITKDTGAATKCQKSPNLLSSKTQIKFKNRIKTPQDSKPRRRDRFDRSTPPHKNLGVRLTSAASLQRPPTRRHGTRGPAPATQPPPVRPLDASRGTPPQAGEVSLSLLYSLYKHVHLSYRYHNRQLIHGGASTRCWSFRRIFHGGRSCSFDSGRFGRSDRKSTRLNSSHV